MDFEVESDIFQIAENHFKENEYARAEPLLNQLIMKNTRRPEVFHMIGTIFYDQGKFNKAIRSFRRALEIDPSFTDSSVGLSIILNDLGRYDEGQKVFDEAKAMLALKQKAHDPNLNEKFATKHDELGDLYMRHHRFEAALPEFQKALSLTSLRRPEISVSIADCHVKMGQLPLAIRELRQILREYSHFVPARLKLGKCFYDAQQIPEAIEQWEQVLAEEPNNSTARDFLRLAQTVRVTNIHPPDINL